ncbi:UNVERIFIED_CONTAM: hypothetical protein Sangu_1844900 [Sesamum angustifolium]|uniref:Glycosyltransferase subfamily 4-like N-terminal domain-containing protein n=1 Tax=Sesamum angustifolium TaxID=2727405 RepID=A0AAW2M9Q9_9LAMI
MNTIRTKTNHFCAPNIKRWPPTSSPRNHYSISTPISPSPYSSLLSSPFLPYFSSTPLLTTSAQTSSLPMTSSHGPAISGTPSSWNKLKFDYDNPPPTSLKIAVFSRKWPTSSTPGGMERHAHTLHMALARRGHRVHIFTSPPANEIVPITQQVQQAQESSPSYPVVHWHEGEPDKWRYNKAWEQFQEENREDPFDVIHSESVALPFWLAKGVPNLAVSWHGIALESVQSSIYQDLTRKPNELMSPAFNNSLQVMIPKVLNEIRFFSHYAHHVAISDSCGEMLRDVYQIPTKRVHVIVNGVNEEDFIQDLGLGLEFRSKIGVPENASLVLGVAGRLVKDKGHPLLYEAFSKLITKHPHVYLIVAGSGPWMHRYKELGPQVIVLGSMNP